MTEGDNEGARFYMLCPEFFHAENMWDFVFFLPYVNFAVEK